MTKCALQISRWGNRAAVGVTALLLGASHVRAGEGEIHSSSHPLSLYECISMALNESPLLEASRLDVTSATEEARAARGQALPKIDVTGSYQLFSGSPTNKFAIVGPSGGVAVGTNNQEEGAVELYSAHLSYPLFRDGSILGLNTAPAEAQKLARKR